MLCAAVPTLALRSAAAVPAVQMYSSSVRKLAMKSRENTVSKTKSTAESTSRPCTPAMEPRRAVSDAVTAYVQGIVSVSGIPMGQPC